MEHTQTAATLRFAVEDTGIGIAEDKQSLLFARFTQADSSTTRQFGGTGLGLAISKRLTEIMGGSIGVQSQVGQGSTFWFTLTLPLDLSAPATPRPTTELQGVRVLIVDDFPMNPYILGEHVMSYGMHPEEAASGAAALERLQTAAAHGQPLQIALVDHQLPDIDVATLGQTIKSDAVLRDTALILLRSACQRAEEHRFLEAGFATFLTKPVRSSLLYETLSTVWESRHQGGASQRMTQRTPGEWREKRAQKPGEPLPRLTGRILLVEDYVVNQQLATRMLEKLGCKVHVAANGVEAIQQWQAVACDAILMDCQMPEMGGYEATRTIRRLEMAGQRIPIIAMTANALVGDQDKCLAAGMDDFIAKPVKPDTLYQVLCRWLPQATTSGVTRPGGAAVLLEQLHELEEDVGTETLRQIIESYVTDVPRLMGELQDALLRGDTTRFVRTAHNLKSGSAYLGAHGMQQLAAALEGFGQDGTMVQAQDLVEQLPAEFERVHKALVQLQGDAAALRHA